MASVKSSTKAMAFGNIIFGGVIGAGVDVATGAAYDYPTMITVLMGDRITIEPPAADKAKEHAAGSCRDSFHRRSKRFGYRSQTLM